MRYVQSAMQEARAFTISVSGADGGPAVVSVAGELDIASAPALARAFEGLERSGTRGVAVDLSELTFIDSSGISALATAVREARARDSRMVVAVPAGDVRRVFEIVRLGDFVPLEDSLSAALVRLETGPST
jgi:anti-sigma B factor antagonist